jgi:HK97 family phage major capsid protein
MASDAASIPRRDTGVTVYFPGEAGAVTASQGTFSNVGLSAKKMATLIKGASEFDEDAVIDLAEWLATEIAWAFANKEDDIGFNGTGTSAYGGMTGAVTKLLDGTHDAGKVVAATNHDTFAEIDTSDLASLIGKLPAYALPGAAWFASQMGFATVFCRLASTAGGIIMQDGLPTFMGFPVRVTQVLPQVTTDLSGSVMLLFGDLSLAATLGERRGVTIARSEGRHLELDQIAWRGTERVDIVVHDVGDASTAGPIVALVGE